jgi:hypothetical protein
LTDLKLALNEIGQQYAIAPEPPAQAAPGGEATPVAGQVWWQDFCPDCKRVLRGEASMATLGREGNQFL